jgi:hypothetical protein
MIREHGAPPCLSSRSQRLDHQPRRRRARVLLLAG